MLEVQSVEQKQDTTGRLSMSTLIIKLTFENSWTTTGVQHGHRVLFLVKHVENKPVWNMHKGWDHDDQETLIVVGQWSRKLGTPQPCKNLRHSPFQSRLMDQHAVQNSGILKSKSQSSHLLHDFHGKTTKTKLPCLFWGTPSSTVPKTATWHLGSDTTISGDITCKGEIGVGSANVNNNIQQWENNNMDSGIIADWFVTTKKNNCRQKSAQENGLVSSSYVVTCTRWPEVDKRTEGPLPLFVNLVFQVLTTFSHVMISFANYDAYEIIWVPISFLASPHRFWYSFGGRLYICADLPTRQSYFWFSSQCSCWAVCSMVGSTMVAAKVNKLYVCRSKCGRKNDLTWLGRHGQPN